MLRFPLVACLVVAFCHASLLAQDPPTPSLSRGPAGGYRISDAAGELLRFDPPQVDGATAVVEARREDGGWLHVTIRWRLLRQITLDDLPVVFRLGLQPDFRWLPHLTPVPGSVISQQMFRSPAALFAEEDRCLALVPDLDRVGQAPGGTWYMDHDAPAGTLTLGMAKTSVAAHVLYQRNPGMLIGPFNVELAFRVRAWLEGDRIRDPFGPVTSMLWDRHAKPLWDAGEPSVAALQPQVREAYRWIDNQQDRAWHEFTLRGRAVGGIQQILDVSWSNGWTQPRFPLRFEIWNQAWFSSLRSAAGMLRWGRRWGDRDLLVKASLCKALALSAPRTNGLFPAVYAADPFGAGRATAPTAADWEAGRWTNSDRIPTERGITRDWFHIADSSTTALWMVRWFRDLEADPELLDYVEPYAEALLRLQRPDGFYPAWIDPTGTGAAPVLADSVESAVSATFLIELFELGATREPRFHDPRYLISALRALTAVAQGPAAEGRWEDFETYWSDNDVGRLTNVGRKFVRNDLYKQNNLGIFWVAEALHRAWRISGEREFLLRGRAILNELSMYQQVWQPPFMPVAALGGFGVMNADGEWNDARQSLFAPLYLDYGTDLGDRELLQRGAAALRASFTLGFGKYHDDIRPLWDQRFPFLLPTDHGFHNENHGHFGVTGRDGSGLVFFTIFDWGAGGASESAARIFDRYGQLHVREDLGFAVGLDGLRVKGDVTAPGYRILDFTEPATHEGKVEVVDSQGNRTRRAVERL